METSKKICRLCLSETELNISISGSYCRKTNLIDKILFCLRLRIETTEYGASICYECTTNVEKYYDFMNRVAKAQTKYSAKSHEDNSSLGVNKRIYMREQVFDADYTFSFLEIPDEEPKVAKASSPFFSHFSPLNAMKESLKVGDPRSKASQKKDGTPNRYKKEVKTPARLRHNSRDLFDYESQDVEEPRGFDWKLTPDDDIIKRVKENFFGRLDF